MRLFFPWRCAAMVALSWSLSLFSAVALDVKRPLPPPPLRILPSFGSRKLTLPGSRAALTVLTPGQVSTLDTVLAEAVVSGERAVVGFVVSDGSDGANMWTRETPLKQKLDMDTRGGGGKSGISVRSPMRAEVNERITVAGPERFDVSKFDRRRAEAEKAAAAAAAAAKQGATGDAEAAANAAAFSDDDADSADDAEFRDQLARRLEQLKGEKPIRSISSTTFCCIASVTSLTRSPSTGRVMGASLFAFQRAVVSRVEVLEGGALLAQPNDWRILVDEPDGGMSPAHYLNAVHAVANQCRAEHLRCAAAVNTLDDLLESGELATATDAYTAWKTASEQQQAAEAEAEAEAAETAARERAKALAEEKGGIDGGAAAEEALAAEEAKVKAAAAAADMAAIKRSMEEAGRMGSPGAIHAAKREEEAQKLEANTDPWAAYMRGDFSLGKPDWEYEEAYAEDDDAEEGGNGWVEYEVEYLSGKKGAKPVSPLRQRRKAAETSEPSVGAAEAEGKAREAKGGQGEEQESLDSISISISDPYEEALSRAKSAETLRLADALSQELGRLTTAQSSSSSSSSSSSQSDVGANDLGDVDAEEAAEPLWRVSVGDMPLAEATDRMTDERSGWCDDWVCSLDDFEEDEQKGSSEGGGGGGSGGGSSSTAKRMMDEANVQFSGLGGDDDVVVDEREATPEATTVRGFKSSADDDELEWYQAFSFVAWQAGAPPLHSQSAGSSAVGAAGAVAGAVAVAGAGGGGAGAAFEAAAAEAAAAESGDLQACLLSTSTLQRLKRARVRLSRRRGDLEGLVEVAEIFGDAAPTPAAPEPKPESDPEVVVVPVAEAAPEPEQTPEQEQEPEPEPTVEEVAIAEAQRFMELKIEGEERVKRREENERLYKMAKKAQDLKAEGEERLRENAEIAKQYEEMKKSWSVGSWDKVATEEPEPEQTPEPEAVVPVAEAAPAPEQTPEPERIVPVAEAAEAASEAAAAAAAAAAEAEAEAADAAEAAAEATAARAAAEAAVAAAEAAAAAAAAAAANAGGTAAEEESSGMLQMNLRADSAVGAGSSDSSDAVNAERIEALRVEAVARIMELRMEGEERVKRREENERLYKMAKKAQDLKAEGEARLRKNAEIAKQYEEMKKSWSVGSWDKGATEAEAGKATEPDPVEQDDEDSKKKKAADQRRATWAAAAAKADKATELDDQSDAEAIKAEVREKGVERSAKGQYMADKQRILELTIEGQERVKRREEYARLYRMAKKAQDLKEEGEERLRKKAEIAKQYEEMKEAEESEASSEFILKEVLMKKVSNSALSSWTKNSGFQQKESDD